MKMVTTAGLGEKIKKVPVFIWILLVVSFLAGFLLRGSGGPGPVSPDTEQQHEHTADEPALWTCSMHPQIKLPEPGQCPICFMDLIPLTSAGGSSTAPELRLSAAAEALADIATAPVIRGRAVKRFSLSGKIVFDETRYRKITAWTGGRIERLYADQTGITVQKGAPLLDLFSADLYSAQQEYLQTLGRLQTDGAGPADALLQASADRLVQLGMSRTQIEELAERGTASDIVTILSPLSGVVIEKNAYEGIYIKQGDPVYALADLSHVWISLDAYERNLAWILKGNRVSITAAALPGKTFSARVTFISPLVDDRTRTTVVRAEAPNSDGLLKPGMFVSAEITAELPGRQGTSLLVPVTAVLRTGRRAVVYVRKEDDDGVFFTGREVILGERADSMYVVISGLRESEQVVVRGNFKIDSAMQIEAKPSMMNPSGDTAAGSGHSGHDQAPQKDKPQPSSLDFVRSLDPVYAGYLALQTALAADRFAETVSAARSLNTVLTSLSEEHTDTGEPGVWQDIRTRLLTRTGRTGSWPDIAAARQDFQHISRAVIELQEHFGHAGDNELYQAFCPMAFDNQGAFWIQDSTGILNPYFGSQMLRCGEIKKTWPGLNEQK